MENRDQFEYVLANLTEQEITDLAMFTLQKSEVKSNDIVNAYAVIKAKIYNRKMECAKKQATNNQMDGAKIF